MRYCQNYPCLLGVCLPADSHALIMQIAHRHSSKPSAIGRRLLEIALQEYKKNPDIIFEV